MRSPFGIVPEINSTSLTRDGKSNGSTFFFRYLTPWKICGVGADLSSSPDKKIPKFGFAECKSKNERKNESGRSLFKTEERKERKQKKRARNFLTSFPVSASKYSSVKHIKVLPRKSLSCFIYARPRGQMAYRKYFSGKSS